MELSVYNSIHQGKDMDKDIIGLITDFRDKRNWKQFHNPKDLAISINLEASELLEVFQWSGIDLECSDKTDKIKEELADVFIYSILMAEHYGFSIDDIIREKIRINNEKYPADKAKGTSKKYNEL